MASWCEAVSEATQWPIPANYPVFGSDAFRTATGVHAAALVKAERKGDAWLVDHVYSGVPAGLFGKRQQIDIGPMSGLSNVTHWLADHGFEAGVERCRALLGGAKLADHVLSDDEVRALIEAGPP